MQAALSLNLNWYFKEGFEEAVITQPLEETDPRFQKVHVPHTVRRLPYDCFDQSAS